MGASGLAISVSDAPEAAAGAENGLVELCRRGDAHAFGRLVALHERMVFGLAVRLLGDPEEARDVAQDVFLQVHRMLNRFERRSSLKTWIYKIVLNHCRNRRRFWLRRRRDRSVAFDELSASDQARVLSDQTPDGPYEQAHRRETAGAVQRALQEISFDHRAILMLREVEGLSCEEIASTLGLPEGTVKSRLARAREALRERLLPFVQGEGAYP